MLDFLKSRMPLDWFSANLLCHQNPGCSFCCYDLWSISGQNIWKHPDVTNLVIKVPTISTRILVSNHFSADPEHVKSENIIEFWNFAFPENFKFLEVQFFLIMIILRSQISARLNLSCIFWKLLIPQNKVWAE